MNIRKISKSINPLIKTIFFISLIYSFVYQFYFLKIAELFYGASEFGIIMFNLSLAFIASFIFYFIAVHIPEYKNKEKATSIVRLKIVKLINAQIEPTVQIYRNADIKLEKENYSEEIFKQVLSKLKPQNISPPLYFLNKGDCNWLEYLYYYIKLSQIVIKEIYQFMPYLELDLLLTLDKIERCGYFEFFEVMKKATFTEPDLSVISSYYYEYIKLISELEEYLIKVIKNY
ncbi:MAG: hypothetical protein P4L35_19795 [Ignavibacteriaceae bacterium]|nr:hypothetical protein [Ignavibacteriaceae bacterium]